jgi:superoxide dismutase, Cu-Zn family
MTQQWLLAGFVLAAASLPASAAAVPPQAPAATSAAVAPLDARSGSTASGQAAFSAEAGKVTMKVTMKGLTPGPHAIHLHEKGDCSDPEGKSAGGHWNPTNEAHGRWGDAAFHHGDIGNLVADASGSATLTFSTDLWTIGGAAASDVIGRAVIVHEKVDDFQTQPTGNAGGRVACGVVKAVSR